LFVRATAIVFVFMIVIELLFDSPDYLICVVVDVLFEIVFRLLLPYIPAHFRSGAKR
jgi:hypothetical protein